MGVSVSLRVVPSLTGLPSKGCLGIGFLSRADQKIRVVQHVAPDVSSNNKYVGAIVLWWRNHQVLEVMTPESDLGLQWCGELVKERFLQEVTFKVRHGTAVPKDVESSEE